METEHKATLQQRMKEEKAKWECLVRNAEGGVFISTHFESKHHKIEQILHKVELDLMTNLHYGFKNPIEVAIRRVE